MKKIIFFSFLITSWLFFFIMPVYAHKITTFAYVEDGVVHTETYFSGGSKAKNAKVEVYDVKTGKLLLTGKTNKQGEFEFKPPLITDLKIVVEAEMGHRAIALLKASELKGEISKSESSQSFMLQTSAPEKTTSVTQISKDTLRQIVREELKKEISPLLKQLIEIKEELSRPSLASIVGGIGYIFGIFGLWTICRRRN
jgi:nickel transport protein